MSSESIITVITLLERAVSLHPSAPAFRIPSLDSQTGQVQEWKPISYEQFKKDVELYAKYWAQVLKDVPRRSVVGLW
jgi:hypothetical protein